MKVNSKMKKVNTIAVVGGGDLANEIKHIATTAFQVDIFEHSEFDISDQQQCNQMIPRLSQYDAVIITAGVYSDDVWSMWLTNTVGPCYLVAKLNETSIEQRIVAITSHGASWISWPEIPTPRLVYNTNKLSLGEFCKGLTHRGDSTNKISVFEPSKFKSKMSNNTGANITDVARSVLDLMNNPMHVVHVIVKNL
jgi:NADP-dependent 3-hydroxy acid dehydrogenase YdfG